MATPTAPLATKTANRLLKHPQEQVQLTAKTESGGDEQRQKTKYTLTEHTTSNILNVAGEEVTTSATTPSAKVTTNGCVTPTALKEVIIDNVDEIEQHTQMTTNSNSTTTPTLSCNIPIKRELEPAEEHAKAIAYTPAAVMIMNSDAPPEAMLISAESPMTTTAAATTSTANLFCGQKLLFCRRFKDCGVGGGGGGAGILRNFNSLPLFVYATSTSTHAISADGVGVAKEAVAAAAATAADALCQKNDTYDLALCPTTNGSGFGATTAIIGAMECLPLMNGSSGLGGTGGVVGNNSNGIGAIGGAHHHHQHIMANGNSSATALSGLGGGSVVVGTPTAVTIVGSSYQQHLPNLHTHHPHIALLGHHHPHHNAMTPYSNNYPLHHSNSHHHIQSEQTKSLQELQHEVGALLEFRDLVIETFPDLKHKMASMSSSSSCSAATASTATAAAAAANGNSSMSGGGGGNTLTGSCGGSGGSSAGGGGGDGSSGALTNASLVSRREWEPGIRLKRKVSQKEPSTTTTASSSAAAVHHPAAVVGAAGELSSSSLTRSRSNSHSGKKEPKSGENNNGSVVQDSGFSTETSSSKEGHSASSTNGAMTGNPAPNRLSCHESDDELLNLLDVIHRKSSRLREEMDQLQRYERQNLRGDFGNAENLNNHNANLADESTTTVVAANEAASSPVTRSSSAMAKSSSSAASSNITVNGAGLTPKTFREHVERLNKEDIKQLRRERDRLLDKLAEMEAETLTGRIKAAKMSDQVEELISVKKDLEEQLKLAMAQKLDLSARVQQLQQQQQQQQQTQSKMSSSQSDYSSQRNFLSSAATTVLPTAAGSAASVQLLDISNTPTSTTEANAQSRRQHTFQPVVVVDQQPQQHQRLFQHPSPAEEIHNAFHHQSAGSDSKSQQFEVSESSQNLALGRLDGLISTPGGRHSKCRMVDSKRFAAILLETSVVELQRHLLTLTVQNQVLMQKLESATKSKSHLAKRLDKSNDDVEDLRFQLEEKNIELEGTKAQLRVLESRIHSVTPNSGALTNSYLHSQNDYETNRSSASTTLMLSRRGLSDSQHYSDLRSATPISANLTETTPTANGGQQMPAPTVTQISTPSMKAMTHLPMDEMQQHSSSTESAHDHELQAESANCGGGAAVNRLMSASVGGVSPFDSALHGGGGGKRVSLSSSKPSKIPLPGSKTVAHFAGKPPSGRPSTAGRSPPSTHIYAATSYTSSKSSLCRSTGNLLYSKSPNSLKRADSAQSIRKDNSSLSTNTSRSSTSSSIPLATHHLVSSNTATTTAKSSPIGGGGGGSGGLAPTPSPRVLQNSPLPKLKRESLTSRVRHLDSLSRVHQHQQQQQQIQQSAGREANDAACTASPHTSNSNHSRNNSSTLPYASSSPVNSYIVSSTPKPSAIAAHLNATLRKDLQLKTTTSSYGAQQFLRRATGASAAGQSSAASTPGAGAQSVVNNSATARRFSSASAVGARIASRSHSQEGEQQLQQQQTQLQQQQPASDSDSGKHSLLCELSPCRLKQHDAKFNSETNNGGASWRQQQWRQVLTQALNNYPKLSDSSVDNVDGGNTGGSHSPITSAAAAAVARPRQYHNASSTVSTVNLVQLKTQASTANYDFIRAYELEEQIKLQQLSGQQKTNSLQAEAASMASFDYYYSNDSLRSSDCGSDNLLVTFDYGYSDSLLEAESDNCDDADDMSIGKQRQTQIALAEQRCALFPPIKEEMLENAFADEGKNVWLPQPLVAGRCVEKYEDDDYSDSWEQQDEDEDEENAETFEQGIWFNTALTRYQFEGSANALQGSRTAFPVHHVQHHHLVDVDDDGEDEAEVVVADELEAVDAAEKMQSLNSSMLAESQNYGSGRSGRSTSSASSFYYQHLGESQWGVVVVAKNANVAERAAKKTEHCLENEVMADAEHNVEEFFDSLN